MGRSQTRLYRLVSNRALIMTVFASHSNISISDNNCKTGFFYYHVTANRGSDYDDIGSDLRDRVAADGQRRELRHLRSNRRPRAHFHYDASRRTKPYDQVTKYSKLETPPTC